MNNLRFLDANTFIGRPVVSDVWQPATAASLLEAMDQAGIAGALLWHVSQRDDYPLRGNDQLTEAIAPHDRLWGCWTILPNQTGELGDLDKFFQRAHEARIRAFRIWPRAHRFLLRAEVMGDIFERMIEWKLPLICSTRQDNWQEVYDLLRDFNDLTVILSDVRCWGSDRFFRPLIERYPNVYLEISDYLVDGGIEAFVESYGAQRMLYGSGYPARYHGGMMLALAHAQISSADKEAIAGKNLQRLLEQVQL